MKLNSSAVSLIWIAVALGCSGTGANPVRPADKPANTVQPTSFDSQQQLWGMWDIRVDLETLTATVMPDRNVENHFNVLPFLMPPKCSDCLKPQVNSFDPVTRILDIDVTLRNKFPVDGYDVRGIVFTDDLGHLLKNEDAWTALFDIPGGDTINPFKAFAKDDPQRKFPGLAELSENYEIWVPDPPKFVLIKYAVDASYPSNCLEPYSIENFIQAGITTEVGSHGIISVDVKDWQGDVDLVILDAPNLNDSPLVLTHQSGDTWSGDFTNLNTTIPGSYPAKVTATSTGSGATGLYYFNNIIIGGWARTWGGSDYDYGYCVAVDETGNAYVTGYFGGTSVDFNPDPTAVDLHSSNGAFDIFLSKFDPSGTFLWTRTWGGSVDDYGYGVAADGSGNVYVTGRFSGDSVDFDPDPTIEDLHTSDSYDIFLSRFDSSGTFLWARTWGGNDVDGGYGVDVDKYGNVFVSGYFCSISVDFDPDSTAVDLHLSCGGSDIFLIEFDASGTFVWARTWGGSDYDDGWGVAVDEWGTAVVTGRFEGVSADFDPNPTAEDLHSSNGDRDVFLSEFDSYGNFMWARTWGGTNDDWGSRVALDGSGNICVSGGFAGASVDFDPDPVAEDLHSSNGGPDIFLSKFDNSGIFVWARTWGGSNYDYGNGVAVDGAGDVYVSGLFYGASVDFDPDPVAVDPHSSNGMYDIFLSKFDPSGASLWARTWGGISDDDSLGVAVSESGNVYVSGTFQGMSVDFDPGTEYDLHSSSGEYDAFLSKFDPNGNW
jgi:hypothetical protein